MRIGRDVLTIANNMTSELIKTGLDVEQSGATSLLIEPEIFTDQLIMEAKTGAQCVCVNAFDFSELSLKKQFCLEHVDDLVKNTIKSFNHLKIQHPLIKIYESKLPLNPKSKQSLNEHCDSYKFIANLFNNQPIDGFLLLSFKNEVALKCALTGIRKVSDKPIVVDDSCIFDQEIIYADYGCTTNNISIFDFKNLSSIDELLDKSLEKANSGTQFLMVENANPSKTAALVAVTSGIFLD